ncbi:2-amino-4-hydroxy-6-hydroxymethyldihydropteridine diphosphokinase [Chitinophagaceae bacterium MMS25-I14]
MIHEAYLLLGSNEGNRAGILDDAVKNIAITCGPLIKVSSVYETAAWGLEDQPAFLNMVTCIHTSFTPDALLAAIQLIEANAGRQRTVKWGQRTLDIDILFYDELVITDPHLQIPHPHMQNRRFTMEPLAEVAPGKIHPALHLTVKELLDTCPDPLPCVRLGLLSEGGITSPAQGTH